MIKIGEKKLSWTTTNTNIISISWRSQKRSFYIVGRELSVSEECKLTAPLSYFPLTILNVTLCVFNFFANIISTDECHSNYVKRVGTHLPHYHIIDPVENTTIAICHTMLYMTIMICSERNLLFSFALFIT